MWLGEKLERMAMYELVYLRKIKCSVIRAMYVDELECLEEEKYVDDEIRPQVLKKCFKC